MYRFDYRSTAFGGVLGACHAIDVPFTFANLDRRGVDMMLGGIDHATQRLAERAPGPAPHAVVHPNTTSCRGPRTTPSGAPPACSTATSPWSTTRRVRSGDCGTS
jgi:hypothetical protein